MPKIFDYDPAGIRQAMERIRDGVDHGSVDQRPQIDPKERRDLELRCANGRSAEAFRPALERYGFRYSPPAVVAARAIVDGLAPVDDPGTALQRPMEGQWRCAAMRLAFTPFDLLAQFHSPEDFDRWIRKERLKRKLLARPGVTKAERRLALSRTS